MKFEIDDKTGMIIKLSFFQKPSKFDGLTSVIPEWGHTIGTSNELETILHAVKKTQEKLVNKQIQEIQDYRKKEPEYIIHKLDETKKLFRKHKEKIEQNQKIVDGIIKWYHTPVDAIKIPSKDHDRQWNLLQEIVHNATGKDIKDL